MACADSQRHNGNFAISVLPRSVAPLLEFTIFAGIEVLSGAP